MIVLLQAPGVQKSLSQYLVVEKKEYFSWLCDNLSNNEKYKNKQYKKYIYSAGK